MNFAQQRRVALESHRGGGAWFYRIYWFVSHDVGMRLLIKLFACWLKSRWLVELLFRRIVPVFIFPRWITVDCSDQQLVMEHELFRHLEEEIFVRRTHVVVVSHYVADILKLANYSQHTLTESTQALLASIDQLQHVQSIAGTFTHHYPICFRRILPDDTLISMASGSGEDWYSISLITYREPRDDFYQVARFLAESMIRLFEARLHWGKWYPLKQDQVEPLYREFATFRAICQRLDPNGVFRNNFSSETFGL